MPLKEMPVQSLNWKRCNSYLIRSSLTAENFQRHYLRCPVFLFLNLAHVLHYIQSYNC